MLENRLRRRLNPARSPCRVIGRLIFMGWEIVSGLFDFKVNPKPIQAWSFKDGENVRLLTATPRASARFSEMRTPPIRSLLTSLRLHLFIQHANIIRECRKFGPLKDPGAESLIGD